MESHEDQYVVQVRANFGTNLDVRHTSGKLRNVLLLVNTVVKY